MSYREAAFGLFKALHGDLVISLESVDGEGRFAIDEWKRPDKSGEHGGGGITRVMRDGALFEQAGVNFSEVFGTLPRDMTSVLTDNATEAPFYACGVSVVLHPFSPMIPTTHANFRYLEVGELAWFGGGTDLTPYYLFEEDAQLFHKTLKQTCDKFSPHFYTNFKANCDSYFYLPHREEGRGIGGIFFDYLGKEDPVNLQRYYSFTESISQAFLTAYLPIVNKRKHETWGEREKDFQLIRRGRYVEFNLLYDRGTLFGLKTKGRTDSILMSLPPLVRWGTLTTVDPESREAQLLDALKNPRDWA